MLSALFIFIILFFAILFLGGLLGDKPETNEEAFNNQRINLLLVGLDSDGLRTDLIFIASFDTASKKADVLAVPDNTRMYVGGRYQKISAAYAITENGNQKQIAGTVEALTRLTAIPINYYIEFSSDSFITLIDEFGGIEFDIPQDMKYSDPLKDLYINLKKGYQNLDGKKAYKLIQFASYDEGVQKRTDMQIDFFNALIEQKFNSEYIAKLPKIFKALDIKTNLTSDDMIKYSNIMLNIKADNISFHKCPGYQEKQSVTYWIPDIDSLKNIIQTVFGYDSENITVDKSNNL